MNTLTIYVSPQDTDLLSGWNKTNAYGKVYRYMHIDKGFRKEYLHRLVAARILAPKQLNFQTRIDFKDGNPYNCKRDNLVLHGYAGQGYRIQRHKNKSSKYRGVYRWRNKWHSKIYIRHVDENNNVKYEVKHLGFYALNKEEEAARAYDKEARKVSDEIPLNFPDVYKQVG